MNLPQIFLESHNIKNRTFGFGVFNYELIKAIAKQNKEFEITLNLPDSSYLDIFDSNLFRYHQYYAFQRYSVFRIRKKFDLWHSLNQNIKIEPYYDIPYLLTIHNIIPVVEGDKKREMQFKEKIERADAITYISNFVKEETHNYFTIPKGVSEYVIYNGNSISEFLDTFSYEPEVPMSGPVLYAIGEFQERKNYASLVEMMRTLDDYVLIISGNTDNVYGEKIKKLIEKYRLERKVFLTGRVSEEGKQFYMKNCRALLFPSTQEGFGLPIVEAMRFGKPVFLSNLTSIPEVGGKDAFYWNSFDPEEMKKVLLKGLETFYSDEETNSKKMKERADFFSWEKAASEYLQVYRSMIQ